MEFYQQSVENVIESLGSSNEGLTPKQSKLRFSKYGPNELIKNKHNIIIKLILGQFKDFLVLLLLAATILSFVLGDTVEGIAMFVMVLLIVILGFVQEYKAEKSLEKLKKITSRQAIVLRHGEETKIDAINLVPGDIVVLEAGSIIPADVRLIKANSLKIDESSLTGESKHCFKHCDSIKKSVSISDQKNMAFMGTVVVYGKGEAIVVATGMKTEFGKIAHSLTEVEEVKTPMKRKLLKLGKQLIFAVLIICLIVFIISFLKGTLTFHQAFLVALSLAVAAAPTSIPVIVTISLGRGVVRLSKKNMLVKKLPAAEALGSTTFICSDKTGTLTKNEMSIKKVFANNKLYDVQGVGYTSKGNILFKKNIIKLNEIKRLIEIGVLCNDSDLVLKNNKYEIIGDPTEAALHVLGKKVDFTKENAESQYKLIQNLPFDSDRKMMTVVCKNSKNKIESFTKGASSIILSKCNKILIGNKVKKLNPILRRKIKNNIAKMEASALRVLGLSYKELLRKNKYDISSIEKGMIFVGLVGMIDPPREGIKESIKKCRKAGIDVMMITGDSAITAKAIAEEIGLLKKGDQIITSEQFDKLSDVQLLKRISKIRICARFMPIQKLRIVKALQKKGNIVAMTGDGVNDTPALKKADLGISMGITGTDVAKEVSEMTLVDDNFSTIVNAIEEGRNIYDNLLKSIRYLLTCNAGELLTVFIALLLNFPIPLLPMQILLMNLLTDGFPAFALSLESTDKSVMSRAPRLPNENPLNSKVLWLTLIFGILMAVGSLFLFNKFYTATGNIVLAQTIAFTTLVMFEMFAVLSSKKLYKFVITKDFFANKYLILAIIFSVVLQIVVVYSPFLQGVFGTTALSFTHWLYIIGVSFLGFIVMELSKLFIKYNRVRALN